MVYYFCCQISVDMENKTTSSIKLIHLVIRYGLILAAILIGINLISYVFDLTELPMLASLLIFTATMIAAGYVMNKAAVFYRDNKLDGTMVYGKAFVIAFLVGLFSALVLAVYVYLFYAFFDTQALEIAYQKSIEHIQQKPQLDEVTKDVYIQNMKSKFTAIASAISTMISMTLSLLIVSLIVAAIAKRKENVVI
jgi:hypothetical protein